MVFCTRPRASSYLYLSVQACIMPGSRGPEALAVFIKLYIVSSIAICLRFYTQCFTPKSLFPKDYISLVAVVLLKPRSLACVKQ